MFRKYNFPEQIQYHIAKKRKDPFRIFTILCT